MIQFSRDGFSEEDIPVVNAAACEMFGYTRVEFTELLSDVYGWNKYV